MNISIADVSDLRKSIQLKLDKDFLQKEEQAVIAGFSKHARLPGFRAGKAPAAAIKMHYAKEILDQVEENAIKKGLEHIEKESKLKLYNLIEIKGKLESTQEDQTLTFIVDTLPEFTLPAYKGITVKDLPTAVTTEEITEWTNRLRQERSQFELKTTPAKKGDYVKISYQGLLAATNQPLSSLDAGIPSIYSGQKNTWEEVEAAPDMPCVRAISDGLLGAEAGQEKTFSQTFPADFSSPPLQNQAVLYKVSVHEVRGRVLPELDEAFLKSLGCKSLEELHAFARRYLEGQKKEQATAHKRSQIVEFLDSSLHFPVPESAQVSEAQSLLDTYVNRQLARGVSQQQIQDHEETLVKNSQQAGALRAKTQFILSRIAEEEKIQPSEQDMQEALMAECMYRKIKPEALVKELKKDSAKLNLFRRNVLMDKTLEFLVKHASLEASNTSSS